MVFYFIGFMVFYFVFSEIIDALSNLKLPMCYQQINDALYHNFAKIVSKKTEKPN